MYRLRLAAITLLCLIAAGCVEGETTFTVNPDGSARVRIDVVTVMAPNFGPPGPKKPQDETIDDLLRKAIKPTLEMPGVVAWKDVSAEFLPNGKMKFAGTAYVKKLEDFDSKSGFSLLDPAFVAARGKDGSLQLVAKKNEKDDLSSTKRKPRTPEEIKKMTDDELDRYVQRELIDLQSARPLMMALLTDARVKTTYVLPGEVTATSGLTRDGQNVSYVLDGNKMISTMNKMLAQDVTSWRKLFRGATDPDFLQDLIFDVRGITKGSITVAKPGAPLFDFDKEVKAAQAAYPDLRKKFGFGDDLRLPTGANPPKK